MIDSYKSLCTEFYDLDKPSAPEDALKYYLNEICNSSGPALEPMCGTGRFLIPVLENGVDIDGTDASSEMLKNCRMKCDKKGLNPNLYYQKLQELDLPGRYGLIFIPSGSFGLITDDYDIRESLNKIYSHLMPDGKLLMEISAPVQSYAGEIIDSREVTKSDSSKIFLTTVSSFVKNSNIEIIECEYKHVKDDCLISSEKEIINVKQYTINEITALLKFAGFSGIEALKPYSEEKANDQENMFLIKCIKIK